MNGLRYHYQHSGAHGQIGLQMLSNGTHPPPAYPAGHKRSAAPIKPSTYSEFANTGSPTVVMSQSTAEALLSAISNTTVSGNITSPQPSSRSSSRPNTPRIGTPNDSRNGSPNPSGPRQRMSPHRRQSHSTSSNPTVGLGLE